jgi:Peptidase family M48
VASEAASDRAARPSRRPGGYHLVGLGAVLAAVGALAAAAAVGAAIGSLHRASAAVGHLELAGLKFSYPSFNRAEWLLLGLAVLGAAALVVAVEGCWRQRVAYRRFRDRLEIVGELEGHASAKVIADPSPQAFCAGYLRPTVYISERALELLSEPELKAVLAHEHHHRRIRDPLRFASGRVLAQALFFVPVLRSLIDRYADLAELSADRAAIDDSGGTQALASALLVFDETAAPGASGISPERVDSLLGKPARWQPPWGLLAVSLGSLGSLAVLLWRIGEVASAHATFALPFVSSTPCIVLSMLLPLGLGLTVARLFRGRQPRFVRLTIRGRSA